MLGDAYAPSSSTSSAGVLKINPSNTTIQKHTSTPDPTFPKFGTLSLETQLLILDFVLATPRIVEISQIPPRGPPPNISVYSPYPVPLQVCRLFDQEALKKYLLTFAITTNGVTGQPRLFQFGIRYSPNPPARAPMA
jgi:hypothetical protein